MPINPLANVLQFSPDVEEPRLPPVEVDLGGGDDVSFEGGAKKTELPDGSVEIDLSGGSTKPKSNKFDANLAEGMEEAELNKVSTELLEGIDRDNQSRQEHLQMIADGMKLLGLVIESNNAATASSSAPLEGMSTVRHPLLLEACQLFQANAMGELLPAAGPVKVRDDRPQKPQSALMGHNGPPPGPLPDSPNPFTPALPGADSSTKPGLGAPGGMPPNAAGVQPPPPMPAGPVPAPPMGPGSAPAAGGLPPIPPGSTPPAAPPVPPMAPPMVPEEEPRDELANALEKDFNHYLTSTAKEYVPDTDQMLFKVGFGGLGIKKVYNCPLRRRPVSESVDIEDFIVSNALSDLSNAGRITHRIKMRPSTLKRMQILEVYRDVQIGQPTGAADDSNAVDQAKAEVAGVQTTVSDPRDVDHELYECYCELDLDEYAPKQFKGKGLPLPYKVTIEKESQKVLEIRRNWRESDEQCMAKEYFVDFPYMRAFGFYCIGLLHLLGNTTKALTALWREFIDAGMFANFPGFLYVKGAGRQLTNQFRVAPGSGVALDTNATDIRTAVMPLPYKSPDAGFVAFTQHVEELGQRLGGTANQPTAEGRADAPVGTTLALIEQASKPLGAVTKRLHNSQAKEFALLKERFIDDPEAFWRFNKRPTMQWQKDQFIAALNDYDLVPVSDPNNPTRMHRQAKAEAFKQVVASAPQLFNTKKAILKYADDMEITGVEETMIPGDAPPPAAPPVDPAKMAEVEHKNNKLQADQATAVGKAQTDLRIKQLEIDNNREERANDLRIAEVEQGTERLRLAGTIAIHSSNADQAERALTMKILGETVSKAHAQDHDMDKLEATHVHQREQGDTAHQRALEIAANQPQKDAAE